MKRVFCNILMIVFSIQVIDSLNFTLDFDLLMADEMLPEPATPPADNTNSASLITYRHLKDEKKVSFQELKQKTFWLTLEDPAKYTPCHYYYINRKPDYDKNRDGGMWTFAIGKNVITQTPKVEAQPQTGADVQNNPPSDNNMTPPSGNDNGQEQQQGGQPDVNNPNLTTDNNGQEQPAPGQPSDQNQAQIDGNAAPQDPIITPGDTNGVQNDGKAGQEEQGTGPIDQHQAGVNDLPQEQTNTSSPTNQNDTPPDNTEDQKQIEPANNADANDVKLNPEVTPQAVVDPKNGAAASPGEDTCPRIVVYFKRRGQELFFNQSKDFLTIDQKTARQNCLKSLSSKEESTVNIHLVYRMNGKDQTDFIKRKTFQKPMGKIENKLSLRNLGEFSLESFSKVVGKEVDVTFDHILLNCVDSHLDVYIAFSFPDFIEGRLIRRVRI